MKLHCKRRFEIRSKNLNVHGIMYMLCGHWVSSVHQCPCDNIAKLREYINGDVIQNSKQENSSASISPGYLLLVTSMQQRRPVDGVIRIADLQSIAEEFIRAIQHSSHSHCVDSVQLAKVDLQCNKNVLKSQAFEIHTPNFRVQFNACSHPFPAAHTMM